MNIILFARIIGKTGVGNYTKQLAEELVKNKHSVTVMAATNDLEIGGYSAVNFYRLPFESHNPIIMLRNLIQMHSYFTENKIDIVHCQHRVASLYMKVYNLFWKMPYVYTLHTAPIPADIIHRAGTSVGDQAIAISQEVYDFLLNRFHVPENKIAKVLNGVDETKLVKLTESEIADLKMQYNISADCFVFVVHSRIDETKNHLAIVDAVGMLSKQERKKIKVVCSGTMNGDYYNKVISRIDELGIQEQFAFTGWIETRKILSIGDALIQPSKKEGFLLSMVEAMFMKVPVIRTKTGGYEDFKDYCYAIEGFDSKDVLAWIKKIISDKDCIQGKREAAYQFVNNNCTLHEMMLNTEKVYKNVLIKNVIQK